MITLSLPYSKILLVLDPKKEGKAKIVGGLIRDELLNINNYEQADIDISTTLKPDEVYKILLEYYKKDIEKGLVYISNRNKAYGTINIIIGKNSFDITTTRSDIKCFGRQAEVKFCEDYETDSWRRDFTINALYVGLDGKIIDYHGGLEDLRNYKVRFIGNPEERIQEDYLRIIRYFRFCSLLEKQPDKEYYEVIIDNKDGLKNISRERIRNEIFKVKNQYQLLQLLKMFKDFYLLNDIFLFRKNIVKTNGEKIIEKYYQIEKYYHRYSNYITIFILLYFFNFDDETKILKESLKLSNVECAFFDFITNLWKTTKEGTELTYEAGREIYNYYNKIYKNIGQQEEQSISFLIESYFSKDIYNFIIKINSIIHNINCEINELFNDNTKKTMDQKIKEKEQIIQNMLLKELPAKCIED